MAVGAQSTGSYTLKQAENACLARGSALSIGRTTLAEPGSGTDTRHDRIGRQSPDGGRPAVQLEPVEGPLRLVFRSLARPPRPGSRPNRLVDGAGRRRSEV